MSNSSRQRRTNDVLVHVLSSVMIRHTKNETVELPRVIRTPPRRLVMSVPEETSYNAIVSTVRTNIVMTSIGNKGKDQSLLDRKVGWLVGLVG